MFRGVQASVTLDNINLSVESGDPGSRTSGPRSLELVGDKRASYERIYLTQIWVHSIVNKLSRGIGRLPLKVYREGDESRERVKTGPLAELLDNPWPGGTPFALKSAIIANMAIFGNAIVVKVRPDLSRHPTELLPSSFAYWSVVPNAESGIDWYVFRDGRRTLPFRADEVMHFKWWGPGSDWLGASPIEALARTLMLEDAAQRMHIASYQNGARPSGVYTVDGPQPEEKDLERIRAELFKLHGGVDNAFKVVILGGGAKWSPMSQSLVDAELIGTRKLNREESAAAYDMPPPVVQILDRATFSNIEEQHLMLYMDTMGPWTTVTEETSKVQLIDPEPAFQGHYVEFDLNEVLKGDITKRMNAYDKATFMTVNEKRRAENMPRIDDPRADMAWMPLNMTPIGPGAEEHGGSEDGGRGGARASGATAEDVRCPGCDGLLAKDFAGSAELYCRRCKTPVPIDNFAAPG
jgi:HK97 family phage portal protein